MLRTVLAIADQVSPLLYEHFTVERWREVDLILSCGDLSPDYLDFLCSSLNVPVLYVRGNHDGAYAVRQYDGSENIHGKIVTRGGLRIAGFEGSRCYNGGPYQYSERGMRRMVRWSRLKALRTGPPNIILTHAPPAGIHDGDDLCHRGFQAFRTAIDLWKPAYFIHGHTHAYNAGANVSTVGSTTIINAYPYHVFTLEVPDPAELPDDHGSLHVGMKQTGVHVAARPAENEGPALPGPDQVRRSGVKGRGRSRVGHRVRL